MRFPIVLGPEWRVLDRPPEHPIVIDLAVALGHATSNSISSSVCWFTNGELEIGLLVGGRPTMVDARRLVATAATASAEVVTIDSVEGILLRPERLLGVA